VTDGAHLNSSLTSDAGTGQLRFSDGGIIRGTLEVELTPETLLSLGFLLGEEGKVGVGHSGGEGARMLAQAAVSGVTAAGGQALCHDAPFPAAASWLAAHFTLPVSLFVEQRQEEILLHFYDRRGLSLGRSRERRLESALLRGELRRMPPSRVGPQDWVPGVTAGYTSAAAERAGRRLNAPVTVSVPGAGPLEEALAAGLAQLGCTVLRRPEDGVPAFFPSHGGSVLSATDETGTLLLPQRLLALLCLLEVEEGSRAVALPAGASEAAERVIRAHGAFPLRLDRDGEDARAVYSAQFSLRDAVFAACRLCAWMARTGQPLSALDRQCPAFALERRDLPLTGDRGTLMQALSRRFPEAETLDSGLWVHTPKGSVWLAPLSYRAALRVAAECADLETAQELCGTFCKTAEELDRSEQPD
jgi:mannose-1-phosphate guanylyltransferase/phosphomannomutase